MPRSLHLALREDWMFGVLWSVLKLVLIYGIWRELSRYSSRKGQGAWVLPPPIQTHAQIAWKVVGWSSLIALLWLVSFYLPQTPQQQAAIWWTALVFMACLNIAVMIVFKRQRSYPRLEGWLNRFFVG